MLLAYLGVHDEGKYDEEEDEAMVLDPFGGVSLDTMKPGSSVRPETLQTTMRPISDYLSADPEGHDHPIKQRRQKLRKKKERAAVLDIVGQLEASQNAVSGMGNDRRPLLSVIESLLQIGKQIMDHDRNAIVEFSRKSMRCRKSKNRRRVDLTRLWREPIYRQ